MTSAPWWKAHQIGIGDNLTVVAKVLSSSFLLFALNNTGSTPVTITALNVLGSDLTANANVSTTVITSTITTVTTITEVVTSSQTSVSQNHNSIPSMAPTAFSGANATSGTTNSSDLQTIASFQILGTGAIVQPNPNQILPASSIGLTIQPGQVIVLLFTGPINTLNSPVSPNQPLSIIGGLQYTIQIVNQYGSTFEFTMNASYQT
ncbi:MAG: hypothetical protein JRN67_06185 [Nitrososphaerota archaeon]|nr:hypothetical protein [Nitrososphaerota archaeon]